MDLFSNIRSHIHWNWEYGNMRICVGWLVGSGPFGRGWGFFVPLGPFSVGPPKARGPVQLHRTKDSPECDVFGDQTFNTVDIICYLYHN